MTVWSDMQKAARNDFGVKGSTTITSASSNSLTLEEPSSVSAGDYVLITAATNSPNATNMPQVAGFDLLCTRTSSTDDRLSLFGRVKLPSDPSARIVSALANPVDRFTAHSLVIGETRGPIGNPLINDTPTGGGFIDSQQFVTPYDNCLHVLACSADGSTRTFTHNGVGYTTHQNSGNQGTTLISKIIPIAGTTVPVIRFTPSTDDNLIVASMGFAPKPSLARIVPVRPPVKTFGVRISSSSGVIRRSTNLPAENNLTMCCWMRVVNEKAGTWRFAVIIGNAAENEWGGLTWRADTNVWQCNNFGGTNNFVDTVGPLSGWAFIAYTRAGNPTATGYWSRMNGRFDKTLVNTNSIAALDHIQFGNDAAAEWVDGEFAHMRVWKRALSETELYTEMYSPFAVSKKDLDTDILGWNDLRNRAPGGEWTYTAVSGGTTELSLDRSIFMPLRKPETRPARIVIVKPAKGLAIVVGTSSVTQDTDGGTSTTQAVTIAQATDYLLIRVAMHDTGATVGTISGVTVNGAAAVQIGTVKDASNSVRVGLWGCVAPTTGNVVATYATNNPEEVILTTTQFSGVHQATPTGTAATATAATGTATVNVTSAPGELVVDAVGVFGGSRTVGAGQTVEFAFSVIAADFGMGGSDEAGAARVTMSWSSVADVWAIVSVPLKAKQILLPLPTRTASTKNIVASRDLVRTRGVRSTRGTSNIERTTNLPSAQSFTMCCWVRPISYSTAAHQAFLGVIQVGGSAHSVLRRRTDDAFTMIVSDANSPYAFSQNPPVGYWSFIAITQKGTAVGDAIGYLAARGEAFEKVTNSAAMNSITPIQANFCDNNSLSESINAEFAHMRVWKRALSEVELRAEMNSPFAVSQKDLDTDILGWNDLRNRAPGGEWTYTAVSGGTQELILSNSLDIRILNKFITPTGLTVTSIIPSILYKGLTNIIITGTDFGATQGTSQVLLDGVPQTIVDWTDTSITFSVTSPTEWANPRVLQVARVRS